MGRGALCALALGRTTEAGELTSAALELGEQTFLAFNVLEARGRYELSRGDFDAAERHLAAADAMASRVGDPMWTGPVAAARAELKLGAGAQEAAQIVRAVLAFGARAPVPPAHQRATRGRCASPRRARRRRASPPPRLRGERRGGRSARPSREPAHQRLSARPRPAPGLGRRRALPGRGQPRFRRFGLRHLGRHGHRRRRRRVFDPQHLRPLAADRAATRHSIRDRAEAALREAAHRAAATGHEPLTREIAALADVRGPHSRPIPARAHPPTSCLTPRETEVLRLLAGGLTNKQIAATLYISDKTAEHHVSHILRKLGVNTRAAAGSLAHQLAIRPTDAG